MTDTYGDTKRRDAAIAMLAALEADVVLFEMLREKIDWPEAEGAIEDRLNELDSAIAAARAAGIKVPS